MAERRRKRRTHAKNTSTLQPGHRELLVSIRFNEPGWQWSGCFLPDHLSDTQMKHAALMWKSYQGAWKQS
ncbi:unnamed protein product [Camellia sinensis]